MDGYPGLSTMIVFVSTEFAFLPLFMCLSYSSPSRVPSTLAVVTPGAFYTSYVPFSIVSSILPDSAGQPFIRPLYQTFHICVLVVVYPPSDMVIEFLFSFRIAPSARPVRPGVLSGRAEVHPPAFHLSHQLLCLLLPSYKRYSGCPLSEVWQIIRPEIRVSASVSLPVIHSWVYLPLPFPVPQVSLAGNLHTTKKPPVFITDDFFSHTSLICLYLFDLFRYFFPFCVKFLTVLFSKLLQQMQKTCTPYLKQISGKVLQKPPALPFCL